MTTSLATHASFAAIPDCFVGRDHALAEIARLLGRTGLQYFEQFAETELGWTLRRDAWGCGYATEAARACADWAFGEFEIPYLTSLIEPDNERSMKIAKRLGMTPLRHDFMLERSFIVYAVTRDTWLAP